MTSPVIPLQWRSEMIQEPDHGKGRLPGQEPPPELPPTYASPWVALWLHIYHHYHHAHHAVPDSRDALEDGQVPHQEDRQDPPETH